MQKNVSYIFHLFLKDELSLAILLTPIYYLNLGYLFFFSGKLVLDKNLC